MVPVSSEMVGRNLSYDHLLVWLWLQMNADAIASCVTQDAGFGGPSGAVGGGWRVPGAGWCVWPAYRPSGRDMVVVGGHRVPIRCFPDKKLVPKMNSSHCARLGEIRGLILVILSFKVVGRKLSYFHFSVVLWRARIFSFLLLT